MDIATNLNTVDRARVESQVEIFNASLNGSRRSQQNLEKDDFLNILITQLKHQDPTKPMEDREFVAQMAQFSSLEQMTNMGREFAELSRFLKSSQAMNLVGKEVEIADGNKTSRGIVEAVTGGDFPQLLLNGSYYDFDNIQKIINQEEKSL